MKEERGEKLEGESEERGERNEKEGRGEVGEGREEKSSPHGHLYPRSVAYSVEHLAVKGE